MDENQHELEKQKTNVERCECGASLCKIEGKVDAWVPGHVQRLNHVCLLENGNRKGLQIQADHADHLCVVETGELQRREGKIGYCGEEGIKPNRFVVIVGTVAVDEPEEIAVILTTLLLKLIIFRVTKSLEKLLFHLDRLLVRLKVPLWKERSRKRKRTRRKGEMKKKKKRN